MQQHGTLPLVDVRTPAEFAQGHIPDVFNIPLLSNEERVWVGTAYKQVNREDAVLLGFDLVGTKWSSFIKACLEIAPDKRIAVHCWRGGMRSGAMAWALDLYGFEVYQLKGGYKAFRHWVQVQFEQQYQLCVLGGKTGSGKTRILQHMQQQQGRQVIDLEDLAQHQGSAYGSMNRMVQPTQEQFENNLAWQLKDIDSTRPLWIEDESRMIGNRQIPDALWQQMRNNILIDLQVPQPQRVASLVQEYGQLDKDFLIAATQRISKRLGPEQSKQAITAIQEDRMEDFIRLVLVYYDKTYRKGLDYRAEKLVIPVAITGNDSEKDSRLVLKLAGEKWGTADHAHRTEG
jgi:tRNA 2-selenouridine synthase